MYKFLYVYYIMAQNDSAKKFIDIINILFNDNYSCSNNLHINSKKDEQSLIYDFQISNLITPNQKG